MKYIRILLLALMVLVGITAEARRVPGEKVGVTGDELAYDFGTVKESAPAVVHEYGITNTGDSPLAIIWVKPKCGCTVPQYPRKPLKPGEKATIKVTFTPKGQRGEADKDIRVKFRNGKGKSEELSLRLRGAVIPD